MMNTTSLVGLREGSLLRMPATTCSRQTRSLVYRGRASNVPRHHTLPLVRHRADLPLTRRGLAPVGALPFAKETSNNKVTDSTKKVAPVVTNCRIYSTEGTNDALELVLSFVGDDGYEVGSPVDLSTFAAVPWKTKGADGKEECVGVIHQGFAEVPATARTDVFVMHVKHKAKAEKEFINKIQIASNTDANNIIINMAPNSWVHKSQGSRTFFANSLSYLPSATPPQLQEWRQDDLDEIKGTKSQRSGRRNEWDRIYDYDVYNDLAGFDDAGNLVKRNILGGSAEYPYPRRLRTGRARIPGPAPGLTYETRTSESGAFWVPLDEAFNTTKDVNFKAYKLMATIPTLSEVVRRKVFDGDDKLTSFKEVDTMYSKLADPKLTMDSKDLVAAMKTQEGAMQPRSLKLFGLDPDEVKMQLPILSAITSSVSSIKNMVGGVDGLFGFPPPLVAQNRKGEWTKDEEWGRQALAGVNPSMITAVTSRKQLGDLITDAHLSPHLEGASLEDLIASSTTAPRLLEINLMAVFDQYATRIGEKANRYGYYGRAVLFRSSKDKLWRPVAIELHGSDGEHDVYTPADHPNLWLLAKGVFASVDSGYHQLVSHWLRTHACTEPYIISTHRNLSTLHPVYKLMMPHWAFTIQINANARSNLINANGIIESCFTPGEYALEMSSKAYGAVWQFNKEGLPSDLIARGLAKKEGDKVKLLLDDYPYADDGMLMWNAVEKWVGSYLDLYYDDSQGGKSVVEDGELQAWWHEIVTVGHADKKEGWPELNTVADLKHILCTMIWIVSAHHSAVNFSQYDFSGYILNRPAVCTKKIPQRGSPAYKDLVKSQADGERIYLETLNTPGSVKTVLTVELLSTHADTEVYMGDPNHAYILCPQALGVYNKFVEEVKGIEATINKRNKDSSLKMRSMPYNFLFPSSTPGLTSRGVPQSVSI